MVPSTNYSHTHRYSTRWKLRKCIASSQALGVRNSAEEKGLVACSKRRKRGRHTSSLPIDVIINILLFLPARVLYEVMRCVCKEWNNIIKDPLFVSAHHLLASRGFIVQDRAKLNMVFNLHTSSTGFKVTKFKIPFPAILLGSCNGLLLLHDWTDPEVLHVMNLITKVKISLPPAEGLTTVFGWNVSLGFSSSGHYKVVRVVDPRFMKVHEGKVQVMVCTVGVDQAWRVIDLEGITIPGSKQNALLNLAHSFPGFVYWVQRFECFGYALDLNTETMRQFPAPKDLVQDCCANFVINMETGVGVIKYRMGDTWEVRELVEPKTGIWKNVMVIDESVINSKLQEMLRPRTYRFCKPLFITKNGEVWLSCYLVKEHHALACYDMRKGSILLFPIKTAPVQILPFLHVNTLLSLMNC